MRIYASHLRGASAQRLRGAAVGVWLVVGALLAPAWTQAQAPVPPVASELSNAFTSVSRQALPAVVAITVERSVESQNPFGFNNPFDWFGEEFFERFFRRRLPEGHILRRAEDAADLRIARRRLRDEADGHVRWVDLADLKREFGID